MKIFSSKRIFSSALILAVFLLSSPVISEASVLGTGIRECNDACKKKEESGYCMYLCSKAADTYIRCRNQGLKGTDPTPGIYAAAKKKCIDEFEKEVKEIIKKEKFLK
ncbi:hypothetical protein [Desulfovibrio sp. JC010]|uniref:hypothetical protein n=1 Tax=Desulfovibrio sp. JC010 TaxID=2593641 RepID=UPI0013D18F7A|nr:hypothetical protein [Desulfovibrio sp. JC010]NDV25075.1 hypothetical protein [Desulfovibrio sp. JC010]